MIGRAKPHTMAAMLSTNPLSQFGPKSPRQGGVVTVQFSIACHPDKKQSGELAHMVQRDDLKITLTPPSPVVDLADQASAPPQSKHGNGADATANA